MLRILLAQHGCLVRRALATVLTAEADLDVVAEVSTQDDLLRVAGAEAPDLVIMHHALPGPFASADLCVRLCEAASRTALLVVADHNAASALAQVLTAVRPRLGLIATESEPATLIEGVRRVVAGQPVFDVVLAMAVLTAKENPLTERERVVLRQALGGAPVGDIAAKLFLSAGTVRNYLSRAVAKTGARTRIEAIRIAHEAGWI